MIIRTSIVSLTMETCPFNGILTHTSQRRSRTSWTRRYKVSRIRRLTFTPPIIITPNPTTGKAIAFPNYLPKGRDKDISPGNCPPSPQPTTPIHRHKQCSVSPRSGETHRRIVAVAIPNYEESIAAKTTLFDSKDTQIGNKLYHLRDHEHNLNGIHHVQFTNFFSTKETFNRSCPIVMNC